MTDILDLADKAARCVFRGGRQCTPEDWQDAIQEAACGVVACMGKGETREGALFLAAKHAIYDWLRMWRSHPRGGTILDFLAYDSDIPHVPDRRYLAALPPMLRQQRAKKIPEDMQYLALRVAGYSTAGIALEMRLSLRNVYAIRERLLPRLARIASHEIPISHGDAIRAGRARKSA